MRVLVVSSWYPPIQSGSSLWAEALVGALRRRGHDVRVVTTCWPGMPADPAADRPEVVYRLPARVLPRSRLLLGLSIAPVANGPANRRRLVEIVRDFRPHVLHQINHIFDTLFLSAHAARMTETPLVGSITTPVQSPSRLLHGLMRAADAALLYHFGVRHWRRVICSDAAQARYALDAYGERVRGRLVRHIHVGLHPRIGRAAPPAGKAPWPQVVTVGHVHAIRDPSNLIRAMARVREKLPGARLDVAGRVQFQAPVRLARRLGLGDAVRFLGEVRHGDVAELMARAHVFAILHQCRYAGLSFTAIEAMHLGVPVVINAPADTYGAGGLEDGGNISLVDGGDVAQIAHRLLELLGDAGLRARVGGAGRRFVASRLDWDVTAAQTERLYEEVLGVPRQDRAAA
jgi:glycosyltransferase involved in cell wall biosynthesis